MSMVVPVSGEPISRMCLGTWSFGGKWCVPMEEHTVFGVLECAFESGVRFFDTAPSYGDGRSEELMGRWIKGGRRVHCYIATKCGYGGFQANGPVIDASPKAIKRDLEGSLRRLGTDYIDLYQLHWPDPAIPVENSLELLEGLKLQGKIRAIGLCNFLPSEAIQLAKKFPISSLQIQYNFFDHEVEHALDYLIHAGVTPFFYGVLAYGLLTGKFDAQTSFDSRDWRSIGASITNQYFHPDRFLLYVERAAKFAAWCRTKNISPSQAAISWSLRHPGTYSIIGAKSVEQFQENYQALMSRCSEEVERFVRAIF